jgi:50S ribosomal protein L16 3-hydroxylase|tara:strand:+ start:9451 stop:10575 length:1125 start_codon:yes stop_codon:yes gene_type:complete
VTWFKHADITYAQFQQHYWRKRPWHGENLLDNALSNIDKTLNNNALFSLSGDPIIESRVISGAPADYQLELGPFDIEGLASGEMLMIQGLEQHLEVISDLLTSHFGFLPRWRINDVMASYGHNGASCGPHFDHYDVFLLQIRGEKHWQLAPGPFTDDDLLADADIRLLASFPTSETLTQRPGDILYIPPGVGHYGIASEDSLTLSIGLRNPTLAEMISSLADQITDELVNTETLDDRLGEPASGLMPDDIQQLQAKLIPELTRAGTISRWFGCYMTQVQEPDLITPDDDAVIHWPTAKGTLVCHLPTRLCHQQGADSGMIFVNGVASEVGPEVLRWFSVLETLRRIDLADIPADPSHRSVIDWLLQEGAVALIP